MLRVPQHLNPALDLFTVWTLITSHDDDDDDDDDDEMVMLCVCSHYCNVPNVTKVTETHRCNEFTRLVVDGYSLVRDEFPQYTDDQLESQIRRWETAADDDVPNCKFTKYHISYSLVAVTGLVVEYWTCNFQVSNSNLTHFTGKQP